MRDKSNKIKKESQLVWHLLCLSTPITAVPTAVAPTAAEMMLGVAPFAMSIVGTTYIGQCCSIATSSSVYNLYVLPSRSSLTR